MEYYKQEREKEIRVSKITGIVATVSVHVLVFVLAWFKVFGAMSYLYPPPQEQSFLIEFEKETVEPIRAQTGREPQAQKVDSEKPLSLVQKSEAQHVGTKTNKAPEATVGDKGDVEVKEPPREKEIDKRALFSAANNKSDKDTLAAQVADKVSDGLKEGHAQGNTSKGTTTGEPNARVQGRDVLGELPSPTNTGQADGVVVVDIWVDQYGTVQKAVAGGQGTTLTDAAVWTAARNAALKAHFNTSADAPALQKGTITYVFKLK